MALKANEWSGQIAQRVGRRLERFRTEGPGGSGPKLTAQAVADRCTALGVPMDRAVIAKLEKGLRQTLTIGELMVLAKTLGVPPVLLLFPLGDAESVEVLPGQQMDTWQALKWFTGQGDPSEDNRQSVIPTQLWAAHENFVSTLLAPPDYMANSGSYALPPREVQRLGAALRRFQEGSLRAIRERIDSLGLTPPALPAELAHLKEPNEKQGSEDNE